MAQGLRALALAACCLASSSAMSGPLFREVAPTTLPAVGKSYGATWADIDGDGRLDLIVGLHGRGVALHLNRAGLAFAPRDTSCVLPCSDDDLHGIAACDFDHDGAWDLYVTVGADRGEGAGANRLWRRGPDGSFRNTLAPGHPLADAAGRGRGALWAGLDPRTGPELLVLNFRSPPRLFRRDGEDWTDRSGDLAASLAPERTRLRHGRGAWFAAAAAGDLDGDGHTDLVLDGDGHVVLRGDGRGGLSEVTAAAGLPLFGAGLMSSELGDVDGDGDLDLLHVFRWEHGVRLWLNESVPGRIHFVPGPDLSHLSLAPELDSAVLADLDNDGRLDLYVMMQDREQRNHPNLLALGTGDGRFVGIPEAWGADGDVAALPRGTWPLDLDDDGDLDLLLLHGKEDLPDRTGLCVLYENLAVNRGLTLTLDDPGGPPHALGARVSLPAAGGGQARQVRAVVRHWNATVPPLHFGVGGAAGPFRAEIVWADGVRETVMLPRAGTAYVVTRGGRVRERPPAPVGGR